jgi:hypothetical protein
VKNGSRSVSIRIPVAGGSLAAIELDMGRFALDNGADSTHGTAAQLHVEMASPKLAGTYRYLEVGGDCLAASCRSGRSCSRARRGSAR